MGVLQIEIAFTYNVLTVVVNFTLSLSPHFEMVPNSKKLQGTTEMWLIKGI